jgi:hypothetical protein
VTFIGAERNIFILSVIKLKIKGPSQDVTNMIQFLHVGEFRNLFCDRNFQLSLYIKPVALEESFMLKSRN